MPKLVPPPPEDATPWRHVHSPRIRLRLMRLADPTKLNDEERRELLENERGGGRGCRHVQPSGAPLASSDIKSEDDDDDGTDSEESDDDDGGDDPSNGDEGPGNDGGDGQRGTITGVAIELRICFRELAEALVTAVLFLAGYYLIALVLHPGKSDGAGKH